MTDLEKRIRLCLLIEKLQRKPEYGRRVGLENVSKFKGKLIKTPISIFGAIRKVTDEKYTC